MTPSLKQSPHAVRVPAFIAAIREDGFLISKTIIPIPITAPASTTPVVNPAFVSQHGITNPQLPIRAATVYPGKQLISLT